VFRYRDRSNFWHRCSGMVQIQFSGREVQVRIDDRHDQLDQRTVEGEEREGE